MIAGIGTDIVKVSRIERMMENHSAKFIERIFTASEIGHAPVSGLSAGYYAGRWASKEAFAKALGCGIGENCGWLDINVSNGNDGRPHMEISGKALETAKKKGMRSVFISISHEKEYAIAFVVIEGDIQ